MHRCLPAVLLAVALGVAGCSSEATATRDEEGVVATQGAVDAFDVKLGDCVEQPADADATEVESLTAVPCGQPHDGEVYLVFDLPDGEYAGDEETFEAGGQRCADEFEAFVGTPYEDSTYDFTSLFPTEQSWADGDREYVCIVIGPEGEKLTGTAEGAGK